MFDILRYRLQFARFAITHKRSLAAQRKWQARHLRRLIQHAYANVPMWRELLEKNHIDPEGISLEDLPRLPVTGKRTYLGKTADVYTDNSRPLRSFWYTTSGSSGEPFTFLFGDHALDAHYADLASLRFLWWRGEPLYSIPNINIARIKIRAQTSKHRQFISVGDYLKDPRHVLVRLREFKPEILGTYPSLLLDIARAIQNDPSLRIPELRFALSFGETLSPSIRETVQKELGCEIYDRYGFEEVGAVGVECERHDGFHVNSESVIVEILDKMGLPLPSGEQGRVVVTDLFNYSMPFIRYDSGDSGYISYEECPCGLRSPRIWIRGRYSTYLSFQGRRIHHLEFDAAMDMFMNQIFQYQIAKKSEKEILVRIVPGPAFAPEVVEQVKGNLKKLVGENINVDIVIVDFIEPSPRGKCQIVVDDS